MIGYCNECNKEFTKTRKWHIYCCKHCKQKHEDKKRRDIRKSLPKIDKYATNLSEWKNPNYKKYYINNKKKVKAQRIAVKTHPIKRECSIKGCNIKNTHRHHPNYDKPKEIIWLCHLHHRLIHGKVRGVCSTEGCNNPHSAKGLCKTCYSRKYRKIQGW